MQKEIEIFANNGMSNIFDGALLPNLNNKTNQANNYKVIGYRLESVKSKDVQVISRQPEDANGVYRATVFLNGTRRKGKSTTSVFFPLHWTKDEVTDAIFEAYQNKVIRNVSDNRYFGKTSKGMPIILWLDENDKVIDAMPFRDAVIESNRKIAAKRVCKSCGQFKHYICLEHFPNSKRKGLRKVWGRIRYHSRKFYFTLARKLGFVE